MAERRRSGPARRRWSEIERELRKERGPLIAGVDEVGRGPLAGPVVACAVIMPPGERAIRGVDDSKALSPAERARLAPIIRARALAVGVGAASVREIDRLNIYHASTLAMRRALARLSVSPDHVLIDGKSIRSLTIPHTAVVHGDARCFSIACASIIAKVTRDRLMRQLGEKYPTYRWGHNSGYATADHVAGLAAAGLTPHHRRSFMRIRQLSLDFDAPVEPLAEFATELAADTPGGSAEPRLPSWSDEFPTRANDPPPLGLDSLAMPNVDRPERGLTSG
jgi:ribonuclease HII